MARSVNEEEDEMEIDRAPGNCSVNNSVNSVNKITITITITMPITTTTTITITIVDGEEDEMEMAS